MKRIHFIVIILLTIMVCGTATLLLWSMQSKPVLQNTQRIPINLEIKDANVLYFNADTDGLHFDGVPRGGNAKRYVQIENTQTYPIRVTATIEGNVTPLGVVFPSDFLLNASTQANITVMLEVPNDTTLSIYEGELVLAYFR